ncbi:MAG: DUF4112 domain-containing protein [Phycisphaerales bacterium]
MALTPSQRADLTARVQRLAVLLDARFAVPFTPLRIGLDSLIGLVPVIGDSAMAVVSLYLIIQARRLGTPWSRIFVMVLLVFADWIIGGVPVLGDIADVFFKANMLILKLMNAPPGKTPPSLPK